MLLEFEHSFQHMKAIGGLKVGLERNRHEAKKGMRFKELKTPIHHMGRGIISLSEFKKGKCMESKLGGKVRLTHNPNQSWSTYGLGI